MGAAEGLLRNASKYITPENKATPYSGIMQTMKARLNSERTTKDLINWYRANPDEYAKMHEAGRTYWGEFGGQEYVMTLHRTRSHRWRKETCKCADSRTTRNT